MSAKELTDAAPSRRGLLAAKRAAAFCLLLGLAGCAQGDFGRVSPSLARDDMHDWLSTGAIRGEPSSRFPLTSDERLLRDLAHPLIAQPYERDRPDAVVFEYGVSRPYPRGAFNRADYAQHLLQSDRRSPMSAYAQLIDDARNDISRLPQFFTVAERVRDLDDKRRRSMFYISAVSEAERAEALQRMRENAEIVNWVRERLAQRALSYRYALERLVLTAPNAQAAEAERVINELKERAAFYGRHLPPPWKREQSLARAD